MPLFVIQNGGLGVRFTASDVSVRAALPSPTQGSTFRILNAGTDYVALAFGNSSVVATTDYITLEPGEELLAIPNARGGGAPTHVAGIVPTAGASVPVQISSGSMLPDDEN